MEFHFTQCSDRHHATGNIAWHRVAAEHIEQYKDVLNGVFEQTELTDSVLYCTDKCCTDELHRVDINKLCNQLIDNCLAAGDQCFPKVRPGRKTRAGWNSEIRDLRMDSLFWHSVWVSCGRPRTGVLASVMRHTRAKYHRAVKCLKQMLPDRGESNSRSP